MVRALAPENLIQLLDLLGEYFFHESLCIPALPLHGNMFDRYTYDFGDAFEYAVYVS